MCGPFLHCKYCKINLDGMQFLEETGTFESVQVAKIKGLREGSVSGWWCLCRVEVLLDSFWQVMNSDSLPSVRVNVATNNCSM